MELGTVLFVLSVVVFVAWSGVTASVAREAAAASARSAATWGVTVLCTGPAGPLASLALGSPETAARR